MGNLKDKDVIEVTAGNKLIAEFMGLEVSKVKDYSSHDATMYAIFGHPEAISHGGTGFLLKDCKYHSSWAWLMPVVERIGDIYNQADAELLKAIREENPIILNLKLVGPSIKFIWDHAIDFIKFYNTQTKQQQQ